MEVEDTLSLETAKCAEVIKARVAPLEEKIEKMKRNEERLKGESNDLNLKIRELNGQVKLKEDKVALYKKECTRKQDEKTDLQTKMQKQQERMQQQLDETKIEKEVTEKKLIDEKDARSKEIGSMAKQLREMTDRLESDIKVRDERIVALEDKVRVQEKEFESLKLAQKDAKKGEL